MPDKPTYFTMPDGHPNAVYSVAFMPDGKRVVSGSLDHAIKIWDVAKKTAVTFAESHADGVSGVAVDRTGKWIISTGLDNFVKVWDSSSGASEAALSGHGALSLIHISEPTRPY